MTASYFIRSLLRIACLQDRAVLEALVTGQFKAMQEGGLQMISSATAGQSFSFNVDPKLSISEIMAAAEEALELFDSYPDPNAVLAALKQPTVTRARAFFGGGC